MSDRYRLSKPVRAVAGVLAVLAAASGAGMLAEPGARREGAGILGVALLLGYGAVRGRSPAVFEDPTEAERAIDRLRRRCDRTP